MWLYAGHLRRRLISSTPDLGSISSWTLRYLLGQRFSPRPPSCLAPDGPGDTEGLCSLWKVIRILWEGQRSLSSFPENEKCKSPHLAELITARPSLYKPSLQSLGFCHCKTKHNPHSLCYTGQWLHRGRKEGPLFMLCLSAADVCNLTWILPNYWPFQMNHLLRLWLSILLHLCAKSCIYQGSTAGWRSASADSVSLHIPLHWVTLSHPIGDVKLCAALRVKILQIALFESRAAVGISGASVASCVCVCVCSCMLLSIPSPHWQLQFWIPEPQAF